MLCQHKIFGKGNEYDFTCHNFSFSKWNSRLLITMGGYRIGPAAIETGHPFWGTSNGFLGLVRP